MEDCPKLSEALGGPRILIKRDDLTGLAFGGNKARHLEFRIADAVAKRCNVFINENLWVSNNARIVATTCAKAGIKCIFVVRGGKGKPLQGNLLVDHLLGAELHLMDSKDPEEADVYSRDLAEKLKKKGYTP